MRLLYVTLVAIISAFGASLATIVIDPLFPEGLNLWLRQWVYSLENSIGLAAEQPTFAFVSPKTAKTVLEGKKPDELAVDTLIAFCASDLASRRLTCVFRPTQRSTGALGVDDEGKPDGRKFLVSGVAVNGTYQFVLLRSDLHSFASYRLDQPGVNSEATFGLGEGYYCTDGIEPGKAIRYFGRTIGVYGVSRAKIGSQVAFAAKHYQNQLDNMISDAKEISQSSGKCFDN